MAPTLARLSLVAALVICAGCFGGRSERSEGFDCLEDVCGAGLLCQYGFCRRPCSRDADCPHGGGCIASLLQEERLACAVDEPAPCVDDAGCAAGQECLPWDHDHLEDGRCALGTEQPCGVGAPCPTGAVCRAFPHDGQHRVCTLPQDLGCGGGCPEGTGLVCAGGPEGGVCREGCTIQLPCADGYECVDGVCLEREGR